MEVIGFVSYPSRLWRVTNRIHAVEMAEQGANFLDVFRFFRDHFRGEHYADHQHHYPHAGLLHQPGD